MDDATKAARDARVLALLQLAADEQVLDSTDHEVICTYFDRTRNVEHIGAPVSLVQQLEDSQLKNAQLQNELCDVQAKLAQCNEQITKLEAAQAEAAQPTTGKRTRAQG